MPDNHNSGLACHESTLDLAYHRLAIAEAEFFTAMGELGRATTAARAAFDSDSEFRAWRRDRVASSAAPLAPTKDEVEAAEKLAPLMEGNGESFQDLRLRHPRKLSVRELHKKWHTAEKRRQNKEGIPNPEAERQRRLQRERTQAISTEFSEMMKGRGR